MNVFKDYCIKPIIGFVVIVLHFGVVHSKSIVSKQTQPSAVSVNLEQPRDQIRIQPEVLSKGSELVREKSLDRIQTEEKRRAGIDPRSLQAIQDSTETDRYTQTEAYLQQSKLRELVTKEFTGSYEIVKHMGVVSRFMAKEAELRNSHWALYHGMNIVWENWQNVLTKLSYHFNPSIQQDGEFISLRTKKGNVNQSVKAFLTGALKAHGLVDDNNEDKGLLLSVNFCPFGNTGVKGESTWRYAMSEHSHTEPSREDYEKIMDEFQLSHQYIDELMNLSKELRSKRQTLVQIFIPKNMIDDVGYLSWVAGIPAHDEVIKWVRTNVKNKKYKSGRGRTGDLRALTDLKDRFKNQQEKDPLFKKMLESIEKGDEYSINGYLKTYCSKPWELPDLNYAQARLLLSNETLLNPQSGIKIMRYNELDHAQQEEYEKHLDEIIKKIVGSKK